MVTVRSRYGEISSNSLKILRELHPSARLSRAELCRASGLSSTSIHRVIAELTGKGLVNEGRLSSGRQGRPGALVSLEPKAVMAIGVDVGSSNTRIGLVDWTGNLLHVVRRPTALLTPHGLLDMIKAIVDDSGDSAIAGIGVGISGLVDHDAGISVFCPNLPLWNNQYITETIEVSSGLKAYLDTSARCMAQAEAALGVGKEIHDQVFVSIGQSIAAGVILGGRIFRGANQFSGEVGHVTAVTGGYRCTCGNDGCLENYVTESQIYLLLSAKMRETKAHSVLTELVGKDEQVSASSFQSALTHGDRLATEHLMETGAILGTTLANLVNILDPRLLVLGGGVIELYPELVEEVRRTVKVKALNPIQSNLQVRASVMGWNGAVIGAALMAILPFLEGCVTQTGTGTRTYHEIAAAQGSR